MTKPSYNMKCNGCEKVWPKLTRLGVRQVQTKHELQCPAATYSTKLNAQQ